MNTTKQNSLATNYHSSKHYQQLSDFKSCCEAWKSCLTFFEISSYCLLLHHFKFHIAKQPHLKKLMLWQSSNFYYEINVHMAKQVLYTFETTFLSVLMTGIITSLIWVNTKICLASCTHQQLAFLQERFFKLKKVIYLCCHGNIYVQIHQEF